MQLGLDCVVVVGCDDGRGEIGIAIRGTTGWACEFHATECFHFQNLHNETHVHEAANEDFGVAQYDEDIADGNFALVSVVAKICRQACLDVGALILTEPLSLFRATQEVECCVSNCSSKIHYLNGTGYR